mgnify:CR=1 FL=1
MIGLPADYYSYSAAAVAAVAAVAEEKSTNRAAIKIHDLMIL